jgi:hypothetical protein
MYTIVETSRLVFSSNFFYKIINVQPRMKDFVSQLLPKYNDTVNEPVKHQNLLNFKHIFRKKGALSPNLFLDFMSKFFMNLPKTVKMPFGKRPQGIIRKPK